MKKVKKVTVLPFFILMFPLLIATACKDPVSPKGETDKVNSVSISPTGTVEVEKGGTKQFTATVSVSGVAAKTVTWAVSGKNSNSTNISTAGLLTVGSDETAKTLTVTATSTADKKKSKSVTVTAKEAGAGTPAVNSVTINPKSANVEKGKTQQFSVTVDVSGGASKAVTWSVNGKSSIDNDGLLTVAADETQDPLTVTVKSTFDGSKSDTATVTLSALDAVWLVGIPEWTFPKGTPMSKETDGTYTWAGDVAANKTFRFSLTDTTAYENQWNGNWFAPPNGEVNDGNTKTVTLDNSENNIARFDTNTAEGATSATENTWTITEPGYYKLILKPADMKLRVEKPVFVEDLTVYGPSSVKPGSSTAPGDFYVTVTGKNNPANTVTWSIVEATKAAGTSINANTGVLTVAAQEAKELTIKATSTVTPSVSNTKTVQITHADPLTKPDAPTLSEAGIATWTYAGNNNVLRYDLQLYKGAAKQGNAVQVAKGTLTLNVLSAMRDAGTGVYSVTVTAIGDGEDYANSPESEKSGTQTVTRREAVEHIWWHENGLAMWVNPDGSGNYTIQLYKGGVAVGGPLTADRGTGANPNNPGDPNETVTDYHFAYAGVPAEIGAQYTFDVIAKSTGSLELDALPSPRPGAANYTALGNSRVWDIVEGGGKYVAGADNGKIAYSADGTTWTLSSQTVFSGNTQAVRGIAYAPTGGGRFVAVGYNGVAAYSDNGGATWTGVTSGFSTTSILSIAYGNNTFVAGGDGGEVRTSADGITWNTITGWNDSKILDVSGDFRPILVLLFDGTRFVAFNEKPGKHAASATGSADWDWISDTINSGEGVNDRVLTGGAFGDGAYLILTNSSWMGSTDTLGDCNANTNPHSWPRWSNAVAEGEGMTSGIASVTFGNGRFIAVGGGGKASYSTDKGATWTAITTTGFTATESITAVISLSATQVLLAGPNKMAIITIP
jgi:hypothetical protein